MPLLDKIRLDFHVETYNDPKILSIIDTSTWGPIENKPSIIEITIPGSNEIRVYTHLKNQSAVFNSSSLLITEAGTYKDLSDGIYKITIKGSPDSNCAHRDYLKTDKIRLELAKMYLSLGTKLTGQNREDKKLLLDIDSLLTSAESAASVGELNDAISFYNKAKEKTDNFKDCQTCHKQ